ncbi:unnamed protein product [Caenorhabditis bovis]|uniref:Gamma interferon inducible lysosomal thiol reductase n=1 Tax=Caenorhabditis bovis TaxID=2654633 RepID=A0A8S1ES75_9PELO|nr:unnamed protein product [Caenorhabditis bovis]
MLLRLLICSLLLATVICQSLMEIYKAMMEDQARRLATNQINIEIFGEASCPDTNRFFREQLMPVWNALGSTNMLNVSYHPFGLASCLTSSDGIKCRCQHGPIECQMNQLQACVISALGIPQLYLPVVACLQGKRKMVKAVEECIVNVVPRPNLDENFMMSCAQSQLGAKLMMEHGRIQSGKADYVNWVPWIIINGRRSQAAEHQLKTIVCSTPESARYEYCQNPSQKKKNVAVISVRYW